MDETNLSDKRSNYDEVRFQIASTLDTLHVLKPNDRSELDRRYAVTITEMEKVFAYFSTFGEGEMSE